MVSLKSNAHIHLIGICGTAMASLAGLFKDKGFKVTGSDTNFYPPMSLQLEKLQIPLFRSYSEKNLFEKPDLVIVGNVISKGNPEAEEAFRLKIPFMSLPQAMSEFVIENRHSIVIAGTHGKTTTTSLMAWAAECANLQPGFMVGGIPKNYGVSFQNPKGSWFVIEGDEYDTAFFDKVPKFIHYKPRTVVLTSVEFDHADIYKDLAAVKDAFRRLLELIPQDGTLVYNADDANILSLLGYAQCKKISVSSKKGDVVVKDISPLRDGISFSLDAHGKNQKLELPLFGEYNAFNAAYVFAVAKALSWNVDVENCFKRFQGVKRRQEIIGQPNNILVIEDFAHHPSAVEQTLKTFLKRRGDNKLHAVFEPRSATSRRSIFQEDYAQAFANTDFAYISVPFNIQALPEEQRFSSEKLVADIAKKGVTSFLCANVDDIISKIKKSAKPGDIVLVMSNGGFDGIYEKLLKVL
ncbi:MAG: UDP-N-acetylmuramate:L-alanyl-gamma-D-glutamyl-meso-diaminopimelate ligase [Bdellovibrionaceae bacterium]|nr:UDP-N-acetylmuramate:L-alanyl-gamma-D-glutamyl-meso-diaminopimelate ligase [Pseudobdellovibrionaceae bacterium]